MQMSFFDAPVVEKKKMIKECERGRELRDGRLFINGKFVPEFRVGDTVRIISKYVACAGTVDIIVKTYGPKSYLKFSRIAWDEEELELVKAVKL